MVLKHLRKRKFLTIKSLLFTFLFLFILLIIWVPQAKAQCCYYPAIAECRSGISEEDCLANEGLVDVVCNTYDECRELTGEEETPPNGEETPPTGGETAPTGEETAVTAEAWPECQIKWYGKVSGLFAGVDDKCYACGNCGLCDFLAVANGLARIIFGIFGGVALVMFLWGGLSFVLAGGVAERIQKAKKILVSAIVGIVLILVAWEIVHLVVIVLATPSEKLQKGEFVTQLFVDKEGKGWPWNNPKCE